MMKPCCQALLASQRAAGPGSRSSSAALRSGASDTAIVVPSQCCEATVAGAGVGEGLGVAGTVGSGGAGVAPGTGGVAPGTGVTCGPGASGAAEASLVG